MNARRLTEAHVTTKAKGTDLPLSRRSKEIHTEWLGEDGVRSPESFADVGGELHIESFMRAVVVKLMNEGVELGLLLKKVRTGRAGSLHL